jgi:hypothetical protein
MSLKSTLPPASWMLDRMPVQHYCVVLTTFCMAGYLIPTLSSSAHVYSLSVSSWNVLPDALHPKPLLQEHSPGLWDAAIHSWLTRTALELCGWPTRGDHFFVSHCGIHCPAPTEPQKWTVTVIWEICATLLNGRFFHTRFAWKPQKLQQPLAFARTR